MSSLFANPSVDLSFQTALGVALDHSVVVTRYKSSTPHLPAENHVFFSRALFDNKRSRKVSVIATGGTGHSPWPEGYIGCGMLTAAVTGATFMAPSPEAIRATLEFVANRSSGIVIVAVNHQNDEFNVTDAVQDFKRMGSMCPIEVVPILDEAVSKRGRRARGLAGSVFVLKLAGAVAEMGCSLAEVYNIASRAAAAVVTYAAATVTCSGTGRDVDMFNNGKVELGVGVHGEPGEENAVTPSSNYPFGVVKRLCDRVYETLEERTHVMSCISEGMVLMLNNLGSTSPTEMLVIRHAVFKFAKERGVRATREGSLPLPREIHSGCFMSSLGAIGFSVSGLAVLDKRWIELLHADTDAQGWKTASCVRVDAQTDLPFNADFRHFELVAPEWSQSHSDAVQVVSSYVSLTQRYPRPGQSVSTESLKSIREKCVLAVADALVNNADKLRELDRRHGNQSLGRDALRLGEALATPYNSSIYGELAKTDPVEILNHIGDTARVAMQGSFGKFIQTFMTEMTSFLRCTTESSQKSWRDAFAHATSALSQRLKSSEGLQMKHRTMIAALEPVAHYLPQRNFSLSDACAVAWDGCLRTREASNSHFGRSGAINTAHLSGVEDPGAWFVCVCLDAIRDVLEPNDNPQELDSP